MNIEDISDDEKIAYGFAIKDIKNGYLNTLWVNRLKQDWPELYEYAVMRNSGKEE